MLLLVVVALTTLTTSPAQIRRAADSDPVCSSAGIGKLHLAKADITILGLTIGSTSLKNVREKLGAARIFSTQIGSSPPSYAICYVSPIDGTVLAFGTGAMGGFVDVTDFGIWSREAKFPNVASCQPSNLVSRKISTTSGIRLGLSVRQMTNIVGAQPKITREAVSYDMTCRRKMTAAEIKGFKTANGWDVSSDPYFDVDSSVDARFASTGAIRIEIAKIESY